MAGSFSRMIILLMSVFVFGCNSVTYRLTEDEIIVNQITKKTAKKLKEQKNLVLIGTGGQMMYDIKMLAMTFNYYQEVDLSTARKLITYAINEYLSDINESKKIRQYLSNYPFTAKNIEIMIFIYGPDRGELPPEKIYCITSLKGVLKYYTRSDRDNPMCKETYEEALQKVSSNERF